YMGEGDDSRAQSTATVAGTYAVQDYTSNACTFRRDAFVVKAVPYSLYLGPAQRSCDATPVELDSRVEGASCVWSDGSTEPALEVGVSGRYWVEVTKGGCTASDTIDIRVVELEQDLGVDTTICLEDDYGIRLEARVPEGASVM